MYIELRIMIKGAANLVKNVGATESVDIYTGICDDDSVDSGTLRDDT